MEKNYEKGPESHGEKAPKRQVSDQTRRALGLTAINGIFVSKKP